MSETDVTGSRADDDIYGPDPNVPGSETPPKRSEREGVVATEIPPQRIAPSKSARRASAAQVTGLKRAPKAPSKEELAEAENYGIAATRLRDRLRQRRIELEQIAVEEQDDRFVWYIECQDPGCRGPALWIYRRPFGVLGPKDWGTSYKPRGVHWPALKDQLPPIFCQCCHEEGRTVQAPMLHQNGHPVAHPRYVRKITREEYEELVNA